MEGAESSRNGRWDGMVRRLGDGSIAWSCSSPPGWTESTGKSAFIWRRRSQVMAVLTCTWGVSRRETRRCVATAISRWMPQSTHSSSAQNGVGQGKFSVKRESPMRVESETTSRASRNRIGAFTRGPASRADSTVRVVRGRILFSLLLAGAACRFA